MSEKLRIALAQFDFPVGAVAENARRITAMIEEARDAHRADLVLFPELAVCGYPPEDLLLRGEFLRDCEQALQDIAGHVRGIVAVVGWPEQADDGLYNAASVLRDGRIEVTYRKRELPNYGVFDERRYFRSGGDGPLVFGVKGVPLCMLICEDLWLPAPLAEAKAAGARLVLVSNASPFELGKQAFRDSLLAERAGGSGVALAYLNAVGGQDSLVFDGGSVLADADGRVHGAAAAFEEHWLVADFDPGTGGFLPVEWPLEQDSSEHSMVWRAVVRGLRDYCGRNGFSKVWLGLSGGLDSAVVLAVAVDALGADAVTAVRLPSRYTAGLSNDLAAEQCRELGVRMLTVPIEAPFRGFMDALAETFDGRDPDVTEENLQSRTRGALMMALGNKFGGLLLTTGNKSEYAVGYATIYGDMNGGYAPLKDLYKTRVFALARWRNSIAAEPVIPPEVISRPPSAELREDQRDDDSLPPYEVLDDILERHIEGAQSQAEIIAAGHEAVVVERVLRLVRIGEWKRHQAAIGPKVTRCAFGRERRYPISNAYRA
ncbi:NAD+ synthase [Luteimonas sp. A277]